MGADPAGTKAAGEKVALRAAADTQQALLAFGALVDLGPGRSPRRVRLEDREWLRVALTMSAHPAATGAEAGAGGRDLGAADRTEAGSGAF